MYEFFRIVDEFHDDPTIYPVLSAPQDSRPFEWETSDGTSPIEFTTKRVSVMRHTGNGWTETKRFKDLTFTVSITDARVVVQCQKFTKGGGWRGFGIGGLAVAVVANAVSHARAMARRKGKLLVAQVRYPWLCVVSAPTDGRGRHRSIQLVVNSGTDAQPVYLALEIGMPERSGPADYAARIAQLAAHERAATAGLSAQDQVACAALVAGPDRATPHWSIPSPIVVGAPGSLPGGVAREAPALPAVPAAPVVALPDRTMTAAEFAAAQQASQPAAHQASVAASAEDTLNLGAARVPQPPPPPSGLGPGPGGPAAPRTALPVEVVLVAVAMLALGGLLLYPFCRYGFPAVGELGSSNDVVRAFDALITYLLVLFAAAGVGLAVLAVGLLRGSRVAQLLTCLVCGVLALAEAINTGSRLTFARTDSQVRVWVIVGSLVVIALLCLPRVRAFFAADDQRPIGVDAAAAVTLYVGVCAVINGLLLTIVGTLAQKYVWFGLGLGLAGVVMILTVGPLRAGRSAARLLVSVAFVANSVLGFVALSNDPNSATSPTVFVPLLIAVGAVGALWLPSSSQEHFRGSYLPASPHPGSIAGAVVATVLLAALSGVGFHAAARTTNDYASSPDPAYTTPDPGYSTPNDPNTTPGLTGEDAHSVADSFFADMESQSQVSTCNGSTSALDLSDYTIDEVTTQTSGEFLVSATLDLTDGSQETVTVLIGADNAGNGCVEDNTLDTTASTAPSSPAPEVPSDVPTVPSTGDSVPTDSALPATPQDSALPYDSPQTPTDESEIVEYQPSGLDSDQAAAVADVTSFMAHVNQQDFDSAWQDSTDSLTGPSATNAFRRGYATSSFRQVAFGQPETLAPDLIVIPARFVSRQDPAAQGNPPEVTNCTLWPQYVFVVGYVNGSWLTDVAGRYASRGELTGLKRVGDDGGSYLNPVAQRVAC